MRDMKKRRLLLAVIGALMLFLGDGGVAPASGRAKADPPTLAGTTRITGGSTAAMWVDIPSEVQLRSRYGPNPDIRIKGRGRMVGFVLTQTPVNELDREFLFGGRADFCAEAGCSSNDTFQFMGASSASGDDPANRVVLPKGRYILYLIADGSPVSVTLRLQGLRGSAKLTPTSPVASSVSVPTPETEMVAPEKKAYWFGDSASIEGEAGLLIGGLSVDTTDWIQGAYGSCVQREFHEPAKVAYSLACPGGSEAWNVEGYATNPIDRKLHHTSVWNVEPGGDWGIGLNYVAAADVKQARAIVFHMSYDIP